MMLKIFRIGTIALLLTGFTMPASPQQVSRTAKIGFLSAGAPSSPNQIANLRDLREGLKDLGWVEGKNIVLELRFSEGNNERLPELAADLLRQKVDIIVSGGPAATGAAKQATSSIPIVMVFDPDPVKAGFVASLAQPGGNITGNASMGAELVGKQMELLKVLLPKMSRIAVLGNSNEPTNSQAMSEAQRAAGVLGLQLTRIDSAGAKNQDSVIQEAVNAKAEAVLVLAAPNTNARRIPELIAQHRLPASYWSTNFVTSGGLMAYAARQDDQGRRVAVYVDKILKGRKPADLPVEQPTRFELVFNMKTAKALGLTVPQEFLLRVDRLIE